jgi:hypothetical protein
MRKPIRVASLALASAIAGGLLLSVAPTASAQRVHGRVVIVRPFFGPYYDPFFYPYGYYPPYYAVAPYGEVKIDTHLKNADVYVDGGLAGGVKDAKKLHLAPGNHKIELRNSDGQTLYEEEVAVTVGHTTKLHFS